MVFTVLLVAWFVLTNHCAVAGLIHGHGSHSDCHCKEKRGADTRGAQHTHGHSPSGADHKEPAKDEGKQVCCTKVDAVASDEFKVAFAVPYWGVSFVLAHFVPPQIASENLRPYDHGPPAGTWFATVVLQRSLFSHAPPFAG